MHRTSSKAHSRSALRFTKHSPAAYIITGNNPQTALGAVVARLPSITDLEQDPAEVISTGDWVKVDADKGLIEITKKSAIKIV